MGDFPPPENNGNLCLVTLFKETAHMLYFELQIVLIGLGPEFDFL